MQTHFTPARLADSDIAESERILRKCVHCGFCTATCPTYLLLGDELDSPRGRIRLIQDMLEQDGPPPPETVKHIDRCLSCLGCRTTCPSGVDYMHLIDHARAHIERHHERPIAERSFRALLMTVLPRPWLFRLAARAGLIARRMRLPLPGRAGAMLTALPARLPSRSAVDRPGTHRAVGERRGRVALLSGCVQQVLAPSINEAAVRLLTRHGFEVVLSRQAGCCGALAHHSGRPRDSLDFARRNVAAWKALIDDEGGLDAIVTTTSGCGTFMKDYGFALRDDSAWASSAARVGALVKDISEMFESLVPAWPAGESGIRVAYHSACSLRHGQSLDAGVKRLLSLAGFTVRDVPENHICCGSAGTYSLLQPELSARLRARKLAHIGSIDADVIATGNIGCLNQLAAGSRIPVVHTVQLLDWATGGPRPSGLFTNDLAQVVSGAS